MWTAPFGRLFFKIWSGSSRLSGRVADHARSFWNRCHSVLNATYYIPAILAIWGKRAEREQLLHHTVQDYQIAIVCFLVCNVILGMGVGPLFEVIYQGLELL